MKNSYRFFTNKDCRFFPCKEGIEEDEFNCLFCYCPLYLLGDKCGGNYTDLDGIKDCSDCTIPHTYEGYDYINKKLREEVFSKKKK